MEERTIYWANDALYSVDQCALPYEYKVGRLDTVYKICDDIARMAIRGSTCIGVSGMFAVVLAIQEAPDGAPPAILAYLEARSKEISIVRPTATKLSYSVNRIMNYLRRHIASFKDRAEMYKMAAAYASNYSEIEANNCRLVTECIAELIPDEANIITHCNTGPTCSVAHGGAMGGAIFAHNQGKRVHVYIDETRPRFQGAKLNVFDLERAGVPFTVITDNMAAYAIANKKINMAFVGTDRIAANGDTGAKIGVSGLSMICRYYGIPFYACTQLNTVDFNCKSGKDIMIEQRDPEEVRVINGVRLIAEDVDVLNPSFDVTPYPYISGIVTEEGIAYPPFTLTLSKLQAKREIKEAQQDAMWDLQ